MTLKQEQDAPLISVCIPAFNGEKYIRECVASVLAQSETNFELLIIDNCSTDGTHSICSKFTDGRVRVLKNSRNIGSIENFNRCIQNASGELIILLPVDDLIERDCLKVLSRGLIDNASVGIAFGSSVQIDHRGKTIRANLVIQRDGIVDRKDAVKIIAERFNPIQHPMVRAKVFAEVGKFDKRYGCFCDIHLWSKVLFCGWDAYVACESLSAIRHHEDQGQTFFRQNTKSNLSKLSGHYGQPLTSRFYWKNHYNLLFFRFVRFFNRNAKNMLGALNDLESVMINNLVRSHLSNIYRSIRYFSVSSFAAEAALFMRIVKLYGPVRSLKSYLSVVISVARKSFSFINGASRES